MKKYRIAVIWLALAVMLSMSTSSVLAGDELPIIHMHSLDHFEANAANCKESGNIEYWHCSGCGKYFNSSTANNSTQIDQSDTVIPIDMTKHEWDNGVVTTEPTYNSAGEIKFTCSVCKTTRTEAIKKLEKKNNTISISQESKTYKKSKLKKKKSFTHTVSNANGQVTCKLNKAAKKAKIKVKQVSYNTSGSGSAATVTAQYKITVPKKCKKGTYKITVKAAGSDSYKAGEKVLKIKVK